MIKNYLLGLVILVSASATAFAQCVPDAVYADSTFGVWPDSVENFPCAYADVSTGYSTVINIKTLTDTTIVLSGQSIQANIQKFRIQEITGLPAGVVFIPNQTEWVNGGTDPDFTSVQGCVQVVADQATLQGLLAGPNAQGQDFDVTIMVDVFITSTDNMFLNLALAGGGKWLSDPSLAAINPDIHPIPVNGYEFKVRPVSGDCGPLATADLADASFHVSGNFPNPFNKSTEIRFTAPRNQDIELEIFNMVGKKLADEKIKASRGTNAFVLNNDNMKPGIYFYTLNDGKKTLTRKMIVSGN